LLAHAEDKIVLLGEACVTYPQVQLVDLSEENPDALILTPIMQEQEACIPWCHKGCHHHIVEAVHSLQAQGSVKLLWNCSAALISKKGGRGADLQVWLLGCPHHFINSI
jgi:hypothetical protein